jgi:hypothetical protein
MSRVGISKYGNYYSVLKYPFEFVTVLMETGKRARLGESELARGHLTVHCHGLGWQSWFTFSRSLASVSVLSKDEIQHPDHGPA